MTVLVQLLLPVEVLDEDDDVDVDDDDEENDDEESVLLADVILGEEVLLLVVEVVIPVKVGKKGKLALVEVDVELVVGVVVLELFVELVDGKDGVELGKPL